MLGAAVVGGGAAVVGGGVAVVAGAVVVTGRVVEEEEEELAGGCVVETVVGVAVVMAAAVVETPVLVVDAREVFAACRSSLFALTAESEVLAARALPTNFAVPPRAWTGAATQNSAIRTTTARMAEIAFFEVRWVMHN